MKQRRLIGLTVGIATGKTTASNYLVEHWAIEEEARSSSITSLVNTLLGIKPLAKLLKWQARNMMIKQAEKIGVSWRETLNQVKNSQLTYPHW